MGYIIRRFRLENGQTIRLDEREIHIYQVEEGYEDRERSGDSGSD